MTRDTRSKISIRSKIVLVLSGVVFLAVGLYLYLASRIFYEDKTLLIYELNQTNVRTLGAETEATLNRILDRLRMLAALQGKAGEGVLRQIFGSGAGQGGELVKVAVVEPSGVTSLGIWADFLQTQAKDPGFLERVEKGVKIPFERVLHEGVWIRNATLAEPDSPALMLVAAASREAGRDRVIYAIVRMDSFLEPFAKEGIARTSLVDSDGKILADSDLSRVARGEDVSADPLFSFARASKLRSGVKRFEKCGKSFLGSYYRVGVGDLVVVSEIASEEAFAAARLLARKSLLFGLVVVTAAFLVALFFSHSLTAPISRLVEATRRIAQGDFSATVPISSRDELAVLAMSFNSMSADLKSSRAKIEEYSHDLEKKVKDRTVELERQNVAIKEAQEALVRTARLASVGEVAGRAAHEVLNPLTNVIARVEKMRSQDSDASQADTSLLKEITDGWTETYRSQGVEGLVKSLSQGSSAQPGKTLIEEDLSNLTAIVTDAHARRENTSKDLDFLLKESARISKIVNGMRQLTRVSTSRRSLSVHALLDEVFETMSDLLGRSGIEARKDFNCPSSQVLVDHDEMIQVFANLVRNSMQAILEAKRARLPLGSPPRVTISAEKNGGRILIRVSDNGPGIPAEAISKVFESSFTTKTSEEGTGLGLSIARRFVRAHDGEITVEHSSPGHETSLLIDLPEASV